MLRICCPQKPHLEPNITSIGKPVAKLSYGHFLYIQDGRQPHSHPHPHILGAFILLVATNDRAVCLAALMQPDIITNIMNRPPLFTVIIRHKLQIRDIAMTQYSVRHWNCHTADHVLEGIERKCHRDKKRENLFCWSEKHTSARQQQRWVNVIMFTYTNSFHLTTLRLEIT